MPAGFKEFVMSEAVKSPFIAALSVSRAPLVSFAVMGLLWGTIAADLPDLKVALGVDEAQLGLALFPTPVAAVSMMLCAPAFARLTGRYALLLGTLGMALSLALPGQFTNYSAFIMAMMVCGAMTGLADVLMTARVSALEAERGKSLMNLCFAIYSFGIAAGAIGTGLLRSLGFSPSQLLVIVALIAGVVALFSFEKDGQIIGLDRPKEQSEARLGLLPVLAGAMVFVAFLTENASENWAALYIETTLGGSPVAGAMGPALIALTMGIARLFGQGFANRFQPMKLLICAAFIAALGLGLASAAHGPMVAYLGFIIAGLGVSLISPTTFTLVGTLSRPSARARTIARATLIGYLGYFIGPPAFGALAGSFGLRATFMMAAGLVTLIVFLAPLLVRHSKR
jgi:MFS family permease